MMASQRPLHSLGLFVPQLNHFVTQSRPMARSGVQRDAAHRANARTTSVGRLCAHPQGPSERALGGVAARSRCPASQRERLLASGALGLAK